jgi:hypothetical protein
MKSILKTKLTVLLIALLFVSGRASAAFVPPLLLDNFWFNGCGNYIAGINTAMINFNNRLAPNPVKGTLMGCAYYGNGTAGGVVFRDLASGFQVHKDFCTPPSTVYVGNSPDIIIGNSAAFPATQFIAAVAYITVSGRPQIDYYTITYTTATTFAVVLSGSTGFSNLYQSATIHLDVIAEAGNTLLTGYPWCDKFAIAWDDYSAWGPVAPDVYASLTSLNAPVPGIPYGATLGSVQPIGTGYQPDVAGIQRLVGITVTDFALVTFTSPLFSPPQTWNTTDWDGTYTLVPPPPITNYTCLPAESINMPRIDAIDDYNFNTPSPLFSYYKAVAEGFSGATRSSWTTDNILAGGLYFDNAAVGVLGTDQMSPTVAFGGNNGNEYQVCHYNVNGVGSLAPQSVFMEAINQFLPGAIVGGDWYRVNFAPTDFVNGNFLNAISTPCNDPTDQTLVAWSYFNTVAGVSQVYYKVTPYSPIPPNYAFRGANATGISNTAVNKWMLYPNPASTVLSVGNPGNDGNYRITDVLGRTVHSGALPAGASGIDISRLLPGTYDIAMYNNEEQTHHERFVKQ